MSQLRIDTPDGRTSFDPGEEITVTLSWELASPPESVEFRLVWNTAGKGTTDLDVVQKTKYELPASNKTRPVTITLPRSPYSFSGQLVSLVWAFELISFPGEDSLRKEITIAPGGREVSLQAVETDEMMSPPTY